MKNKKILKIELFEKYKNWQIDFEKFLIEDKKLASNLFENKDRRKFLLANRWNLNIILTEEYYGWYYSTVKSYFEG